MDSLSSGNLNFAISTVRKQFVFEWFTYKRAQVWDVSVSVFLVRGYYSNISGVWNKRGFNELGLITSVISSGIPDLRVFSVMILLRSPQGLTFKKKDNNLAPRSNYFHIEKRPQPIYKHRISERWRSPVGDCLLVVACEAFVEHLRWKYQCASAAESVSKLQMSLADISFLSNKDLVQVRTMHSIRFNPPAAGIKHRDYTVRQTVNNKESEKHLARLKHTHCCSPTSALHTHTFYTHAHRMFSNQVQVWWQENLWGRTIPPPWLIPKGPQWKCRLLRPFWRTARHVSWQGDRHESSRLAWRLCVLLSEPINIDKCSAKYSADFGSSTWCDLRAAHTWWPRVI